MRGSFGTPDQFPSKSKVEITLPKELKLDYGKDWEGQPRTKRFEVYMGNRYCRWRIWDWLASACWRVYRPKTTMEPHYCEANSKKGRERLEILVNLLNATWEEELEWLESKGVLVERPKPV